MSRGLHAGAGPLQILEDRLSSWPVVDFAVGKGAFGALLPCWRPPLILGSMPASLCLSRSPPDTVCLSTCARAFLPGTYTLSVNPGPA